MHRYRLPLAALGFVFLLGCSSVSIGPLSHCTAAPQGLVAWWRFNEPVGTIAADTIGGHHATHHNGVMSVEGLAGNALQFDGLDSYVTAPHADALNPGSAFSLAFWIRPEPNETGGTIYRKGVGAPAPPYLASPGFHLLLREGNLLAAFQGAGGSHVANLGPPFNEDVALGAWTFVTVTFDFVAGEAMLYSDGGPRMTQPLPTNLGSLANTHPVVIGGGEASPSPDESFAGILDEIDFYDRALSEGAVISIKIAERSGKCGPQICNGPQTLRVSGADRPLAFFPDEFGALFGCAGGSGNPASNGVRFDPEGPLPEANVNCNTMLYVFEPKTRRRQVLSFHAIARNSVNCCADPGPPRGECFYEPQCLAIDHAHVTCSDVTFDSGVVSVSPGRQQRTTRFNLPNFPLRVELVQDAYADRLEQTYRFTNTSAAPLDLRITRVADADLGYVDDGTASGVAVASASGYVRNIPSFVPFGAEIHDNTVDGTLPAPAVSFVVTAPDGNGSDATFEGARLQGNGGSTHGRVWWNYGIPDAELGRYGISGEYWEATWAGDPATPGESDQAVAIQSRLTIPAGLAKTYVTVTKVQSP